MKKPLILACLTLIVAANSRADINDGKELLAENCTRCHDSSMYQRPNPRVIDLPGLGKQVRFCKNNLGLTWFDDEVGDVINYLNSDYYHFK